MDCEICGKPNSQIHHIFFQSQSIWLKKLPLNLKSLCIVHHNGNQGPHRNREVDIKYKMEVQKKLFKLFSNKNYFTEKEIKEKLFYTPSEVRKFIKTLHLHKEGYDRIDIIQKLQGGRFYAK